MYDIEDVREYFEYIIRKTNETAIYPEAGEGTRQSLAYVALGLGEVGEYQGKVKKLLRDGSLDLDGARKELGDVFWYWIRNCVELNIDPVDVIEENIAKLQDRKARGVIQGSGDDR